MGQKILAELSASRQTIKKWFGVEALEAADEINGIISPWLCQHYPEATNTYQMYLVREDSGYIGRKYSNLYPDCPEFYPVRPAEHIGTDIYGYYHAPLSLHQLQAVQETASMLAAHNPPAGLDTFVPEEITHQIVYSAHRENDKMVNSRYGSEVQALADHIPSALNLGQTDSYLSYYVDQYAGNDSTEPVYSGMIYSNLIYGCPWFYPLYFKDHFVNAHSNGYRDIVLPQDMLGKILSMDYTGCNLDARNVPQTNFEKN